MHILGTENPDTLTGTAGDDQIEALASDDILHGGAGNDSLDGGSGSDQLFGGAGADDLYGGTGRDILDGGAGADLLYGGDGIDTVDYSANSTAIAVDGGRVTGGGDAAGDRLDSIESVIGSAFADTMHFDGASTLDGRGGNDILSGADTLLGGDGNDTLSQGHELHGGAGEDTLTGLAGGLLHGDDGNDTLNGLAATIDGGGGDGNDTYNISLASGTVSLAKGYVSSTAGVSLISHLENVTVTGENIRMNGDDHIIGGLGEDLLNGGTGADTFIYETVDDSHFAGSNINISSGFPYFGIDGIIDFSSMEGDKIDLSAIDADGNPANGRTAFTFIGEAEPKNIGEIGFSEQGPNLDIDVKTPSHSSNLEIHLLNVSSLTATDFVL